MATQIKTGPKYVFGILLAVMAFFAIKHFIPASAFSLGGPAVVPKVAVLPDLPAQKPASGIAAIPLPGAKPIMTSTMKPIGITVWAWNAQIGLMFANGGPATTEGSLISALDLDVTLHREDDTTKMAGELLSFAREIKDGGESPKGVHFIVLMGDGTPSFFAGLNPELRKICADCTAEIIAGIGYSRGEDKLMGPPEWKDTPKKARGALIAGVLRDGDWNVAMKWAGDNGLKNNPDETTYDPDALNWVSADTYVEAAKKYILDVCEDRKVVQDGKPTGATKHVCVNGVVTWTPGDVDVATKKGGLATIVSTREYSSQMPAALIGIKKWNASHRTIVEGLLQAIFDGGDQVRSHPEALRKAAEISALVYGEENAAYWEKYFKGVTEADKTGLQVALGGSSVNNLADNVQLFGLAPGSADILAATYTVFGDIAVQQYPKLVPSYPPTSEIENASFVKALMGRAKAMAPAETVSFREGAGVTSAVSKRSWAFTFQTGSAAFTPETLKMLEKLKDDAIVADELAMEIHGYTDNTGDPARNVTLSNARAGAIRDWLMRQSSTNFPASRFTVVGHGQADPAASNDTEEGRAKNRRVVIVFGSQGAW